MTNYTEKTIEMLESIIQLLTGMSMDREYDPLAAILAHDFQGKEIPKEVKDNLNNGCRDQKKLMAVENILRDLVAQLQDKEQEEIMVHMAGYTLDPMGDQVEFATFAGKENCEAMAEDYQWCGYQAKYIGKAKVL